MRHASILTVLFVVAGGGGNWSNRDLEFVNALPTRAELKAKLPVPESQGLTGVQTRQDGLNVGDPSKAYADSKGAAAFFNGFLDFFLTVVDTVRTLPPSTRTSSTRTWGPWPDKDNTGFEFQVTISEVAAARLEERAFDWAIQARPRGGAFFDVVRGDYTATDTVKHGSGNFVMPVAEFRDVLKVSAELAQLDEINVHYANQVFPKIVSMNFIVKSGGVSPLSRVGYDYSEWADKSGKLTFEFDTLSLEDSSVAWTSDWLANGAGRATGLVTAGTARGANAVECWDTSFKVTYYSASWAPPPSGNAVDCVVVAHP